MIDDETVTTDEENLITDDGTIMLLFELPDMERQELARLCGHSEFACWKITRILLNAPAREHIGNA